MERKLRRVKVGGPRASNSSAADADGVVYLRPAGSLIATIKRRGRESWKGSERSRRRRCAAGPRSHVLTASINCIADLV